jgi:hypothetical protein
LAEGLRDSGSGPRPFFYLYPGIVMYQLAGSRWGLVGGVR